MNFTESTFKVRLPWWAKPLAKWAVTRLPISYRQWARVGLFRHGFMDDPTYAERVFRQHFERAQPELGGKDFVGLELGPGDSIASAMIAATFGAKQYYLVDVEELTTFDVRSYQKLAEYLKSLGRTAPGVDANSTLNDILRRCNAQYFTHGLESLRQIPSGTVDFIWSHVVLQDVRRSQFDDYLREMRRILSPHGVCSHRIDLKDLMAASLNNLRFSERFWESTFITASGYYSNRIRYEEMLERFRRAGFEPKVTSVRRWPELPIDRKVLAEPFRQLADDDLLVAEFEVLLTPGQA